MKKEQLTIYLGADHAGFELKEKIKNYLKNKGIRFVDLGPEKYDKDDDYPDYIIPTANAVSKNKNSLGIILGGSGQGEAIIANKVKGIRAVVLYHYSQEIIKLSKEHNNANILSLGARFLTEDQAIESIKLWLSIKFSNEERHKRRLKKISDFENRKDLFGSFKDLKIDSQKLKDELRKEWN